MKARTEVLKAYLSPEEMADFHSACSAQKVTRSEAVRAFCINWVNDRARMPRREGPSQPKRKAQLPGYRVSYGVVPCVRMRV